MLSLFFDQQEEEETIAGFFLSGVYGKIDKVAHVTEKTEDRHVCL